MKKLYIKQKVFSIGEKFTVVDEDQRLHYSVKGSFMKIPKFFVEINGKEAIEISKQLSFFKAKDSISAEDVTVDGNWWDMDFDVSRKGRKIAEINKRWISWGDTYEITILDESLEELIISLVIAIDCVKEDEAAASSASS